MKAFNGAVLAVLTLCLGLSCRLTARWTRRRQLLIEGTTQRLWAGGFGRRWGCERPNQRGFYTSRGFLSAKTMQRP